MLEKRVRLCPRGAEILHNPVLNKGTAFTEAEREALGLVGLLPHSVLTIEEQVAKIYQNFCRKTADLEKYIFLTALQDRNETLFYRSLLEHIEEMMPIIYTPAVGEACQRYCHIWRRPRGLFIRRQDRDHMRQILRNWPETEVGIIVVTDGERILGLGDLGANGMGIPVGKLTLYTACAGVHPVHCLPITLDVGTNNQALLDDPLYIGTRERRLEGQAYDDFIEAFVQAVMEVFPQALIQFEDFSNHHAFRLLERYRDRCCAFNDDIQGTAGVALAGVLSALRMNGGALRDQRFLFLGAGEAGIGIGDLLVAALELEGLSRDEARRRCRFVDSRGLVCSARTDLQPHKLPYAHDVPPRADLLAAIADFKPTALLGVSGTPNSFTQAVVEAMCAHNRHPIIFAMSNPTSKSECSAAEAYGWSEGRAIFASGSPFPPCDLGGRRFVPGQANNAYVFPGIGLGVVSTHTRRVTDEMFYVAARTLAALARDEDHAVGCIFPPLTQIREVSLAIAVAVAEVAFARDLAGIPRPVDLEAYLRACQYVPTYPNYVAGG